MTMRYLFMIILTKYIPNGFYNYYHTSNSLRCIAIIIVIIIIVFWRAFRSKYWLSVAYTVLGILVYFVVSKYILLNLFFYTLKG